MLHKLVQVFRWFDNHLFLPERVEKNQNHRIHGETRSLHDRKLIDNLTTDLPITQRGNRSFYFSTGLI